jgi:tagatose-1,6-bisphosphate aldolase
MTKKELSIGKYRGIQQIATPEGAFTMLALDHQESFAKASIQLILCQ